MNWDKSEMITAVLLMLLLLLLMSVEPILFDVVSPRCTHSGLVT